MLRILFLNIFVFFSLTSSAQQLEVYFDFDKHTLNAQAMRELNAWAGKNQHVEVSKIYGYCDWKGSSSYNDTLSLKRVDEVYNFLRNSGIKVLADYEMIGFGKDFEQEKDQWANRKVVVHYSDKPRTAITTIDSTSLGGKIKRSKNGDKIKLENINFFNMSARVVPQSQPVLYELLCAMQENPSLKIEIQGHICCQTEGDNDLTYLSTQRAKIIYNYLVRKKIDRKRLSYKGYGNTQPIYPIPEKNEEERDANRRVEILIVEN
ncbi:MAG: OmpA family protein [Flavobacterium sp.]|nr:OmpA family protein [Flavobacterium sp.]